MEARKQAMYADETHKEVQALSIRDETESYSLTEEEKVEEIDIIHHVAVTAAGAVTSAVTYEQKKEELEMLKLQLFGSELDEVVQRFSFKAELYEKQCVDKSKAEIQALEGRFSERIARLNMLEINIEEINSKHRKFVQYLEGAFKRIEE